MQVNVFVHCGISCCIRSVDAVFVVAMFQLIVTGSKGGEFELETAEAPHFQTLFLLNAFQMVLGVFVFYHVMLHQQEKTEKRSHF